ncbi:ATP-binding protein [Pseudanabaena sp. UWO310]|uniref:ATP-binding protein n=1 Tax=Pseudanabaena sp. UWO310 TaxID=2480795 RepID=UPI00115A5F11|nr:ATP-binding protein [Pseudanabaena sp. UWO310]TYQ28168.1 ATP-binding protein [Pseudanabaena sp. UWO310]
MSEQNSLSVNASPTKELFISMLTKDLVLIDAIADLVDNCVDGAKRLRHSEDYTGLFVHLEVTSEQFRIVDNCGGIDVTTAREHAFCFGRPSGMVTTNHSIGNFGVGMKRALFKLGKFFSIESCTQNSRFSLEQNIEAWAVIKEWNFRFNNVEENVQVNETDIGTRITVSDLYPGVSSELGLETFISRLKIKLQSIHQITMEKGFLIKLNNIQLDCSPPCLASSDTISPSYKEKEIVNEHEQKVNVRMYAGLSIRDPSKAGWSIYCNDRLILEADKSLITGWGKEADNPDYHNTYARFRGFVFFDSIKSDLLPWNTTKNNIDAELPLFREIRDDMILEMKPVMGFLKKVAKEKRYQENNDPTPLEIIINSADFLPLKHFTKEQSFIYPSETQTEQTSPAMSTIKYQMPLEDVKQVKEVLKVKTAKEVGEKTFEYFMRMECND